MALHYRQVLQAGVGMQTVRFFKAHILATTKKQNPNVSKTPKGIKLVSPYHKVSISHWKYHKVIGTWVLGGCTATFASHSFTWWSACLWTETWHHYDYEKLWKPFWFWSLAHFDTLFLRGHACWRAYHGTAKHRRVMFTRTRQHWPKVHLRFCWTNQGCRKRTQYVDDCRRLPTALLFVCQSFECH